MAWSSPLDSYNMTFQPQGDMPSAIAWDGRAAQERLWAAGIEMPQK